MKIPRAMEVSDVAGATWQFIFLVAGIVGNMAAVVFSRMFLGALRRRETELDHLKKEVQYHHDVIVANIANGCIRPVEA